MVQDDIMGRLDELARDLKQQSDSRTALEFVLEGAVALIGPCDAASVSLVRRRGQFETVAATAELASFSDKLQAELHEGPYVDELWDHEVVYIPDCRDEPRWSTWAARICEELGIHSILCVRLFPGENRLGVLNLFAPDPDAFDEDDRKEAIAIAAHAAVAVSGIEEVAQLRAGIAHRTVIGQATGLLMHRFGLTTDAAFNVLVRYSSHQNRKLLLVAQELVSDWDSTRSSAYLEGSSD